MKFVAAPDSYKECLSSAEVAEAMEEGILRVFPDSEVVKIPIADGGEGTIQAIKEALGGRMFNVEVIKADGFMRQASYLVLPDGTAVIEVAQSSGLEHIAFEERNPFTATSFGTGELILTAIQHGCKKIIVGLGGSGCNDGGAGMLQALGVKLCNKNGIPIALGNGQLKSLHHADLSTVREMFADIQIDIITDVINPLCGKSGASYVFGPQKGAKPDDLAILDENVAHFAQVIEETLQKSYQNLPGSGAAGGIGFALQTLTDNVVVHKGIEYLLNLIDFVQKIEGADLILTGEGSTDFQTAYGKAPSGIVTVATIKGIPSIIISGKVIGDLTAFYELGVVSVHSILHDIATLEEAKRDARENIVYTTEAIIRTRYK